MSVVPIVFLGTPEFASFHLEKLLQDEHFDVVGVVTQPDRPAGRKLKLKPSAVKECALAHNLPVITPESFREPSVLETVKQWNAEAAVVVAYGQILPQSFLDLFPQKVVNVHGSLLPKWRGAAPIQRALMNGDTETGVALQVMVKKLDAGDVLGERRLSIGPEVDAIELHDQLKVLGADLLHIEFMDYLRGNLVPTQQDESQVTYAHKIEKSEGRIDWNLSAQEIFNRHRGLQLGPGSHTLFEGKVLKIKRMKPVESSGPAELSSGVGGVVEVGKDFFTVCCGQGTMCITQVQPEGKSAMAVSEYLKGRDLSVGQLFGN